jgi:Ca2+-transporting ATPase
LAEEGYNELTLATRRHLTGIVREVLSEGVRQRIPGREVARGDLIVVSEGDRVPADARLIETKHLEVDEAILTGESVPASKHAWRPENNLVPTPGGVGLSFIFSGTLVVKGDAIG